MEQTEIILEKRREMWISDETVDSDGTVGKEDRTLESVGMVGTRTVESVGMVEPAGTVKTVGMERNVESKSVEMLGDLRTVQLVLVLSSLVFRKPRSMKLGTKLAQHVQTRILILRTFSIAL